MFKQQVVSVTDLRTKTKNTLMDLEKGPKFVFSNNVPVAVLMTVEEYELLTQPDLIELPEFEVSPALKAMAKDALLTPKKDLINI